MAHALINIAFIVIAVACLPGILVALTIAIDELL